MTDSQGSCLILKADAEGLQQATAAIQAGALVGMPTETVYGLAADFRQEQALRSIFAMKKRPFADPLILHVADLSAARELWDLTDAAKPLVEALASRFWPGPLTIVAQKAAHVSPLVTGAGDSVGVRVPQHPIAQALIRRCETALAAPSANLFGHVSPTRAVHVADDFSDQSLLILDGDAASFGIESTVIKVHADGQLEILRYGVVQDDEIQALFSTWQQKPILTGKMRREAQGKQESPGQHLKHYAPQKGAYLLKSGPEARIFPLPFSERSCQAFACFDFGQKLLPIAPVFGAYFDLSPSRNTQEASFFLFDALRKWGSTHKILLPEFSETSAQEKAIFDRVYRAAMGKIAYLRGSQLWVQEQG